MSRLSKVLSRHKWKLYAHGQHIVVVNNRRERFVHPLMKAFLWALYMPPYQNITIEVRIGDKYKPDVVAFAPETQAYQTQMPVLWGEAGRVGRDKIQSLVKRYPDTHFAIGKWQTRLAPYIDIVAGALERVKRSAPFDLINFPIDSQYLIDDDGHIHISFADVDCVRLEPGTG